MKKSVQQLMDERMCRPGYRWNDTLKRCLGAGGGGGDKAPEPPPEVDPIDTADPAAPAPPAATGRGDVRMNANGIVQKGTSMGGKGVSIK